MAKTYTYAVVPNQGCYGSGSQVRPDHRTNSIETARKVAARFTRRYKAAMSRHGGSGGGYRVIEWSGREATVGYILGCDLGRRPSV